MTDGMTGEPYISKVEAEIYEYKGFQFGIYWSNHHKKNIRATELQTGRSIAQVYCSGTKSPKKDLLRRIEFLVDNMNLEHAISKARNDIETTRRNLDEQIRALEQKRDCFVFPLNEKV